MRDSSDMELVRDYARQNSEAAFAELVQRHVNLVYSVALRQTGIAAQAEEITQAVFVILARKAASLRDDTLVAAWLYETSRLTALSSLRTERRRQFREQEAHMESMLQESPATDPLWHQIAPLLDEAMSRLGRKEREAVVLRFFKDKSLRETAAGLNISEAAAQKRVNRALEKLHRYFGRRGISSTTAIIASEITANSIQMAPVGLAKAVTAASIIKGATASTSTLTLIKGALKAMAWAKVKTAVTLGVGALLMAGTATITVKEVANVRPYPWQLMPGGGVRVLDNTPPQVRIVPTLKNRFPQGDWTADYRIAGWGHSAKAVVLFAYSGRETRTEVAPDVVLPAGLYDFMANLPKGAREALQQEVRRKFGVTAHREMQDRAVLLLKVKTPNARGLKRSTGGNTPNSSSGDGFFTMQGQSLPFFCGYLEDSLFHTPMVDSTGLAGGFDIDFHWNQGDDVDALKQALADQLGLELVPTNMPMEILVVTKAKG